MRDTPGAGDAAAGSGFARADTCGSDDDADPRLRDNTTRRVVNNLSVYVSRNGGLISTLRLYAIDLLSSPHFETIIGMVIVVNSVTIGFELSLRLEEQDTGIIEDLEHLFLAIYTLELALRFFAMGIVCMKDVSVVFDCVLVTSGGLMTWILRPMGHSELGDTSGLVGVLRTLRLLRLARTVRLIVKFRELWMLVRSMMNSASTMCYTCLLLIIVLYILACVGVELVGLHDLASSDADPAFRTIAQQHFRSVGITMVTLVQFVTLDSVGMIYRPLIEADALMALYFMGTILVVGIVLMNLITAVIVNSALEQASQDKDAAQMHERKKKEKFIRDLRKMFERLDQDKSGQVTREEISNVNDRDRALFFNAIELSNPMEIFDALDVDDSGHIDIDEFCDGIRQVALAKMPIEMKKISKQVMLMRETMAQFLSSQAKLENKIGVLMKAIVHTPGRQSSGIRDSASGASGVVSGVVGFGRSPSSMGFGHMSSGGHLQGGPVSSTGLPPAPTISADPDSVAPPWVKELARDLRNSLQAAMLEFTVAAKIDAGELSTAVDTEALHHDVGLSQTSRTPRGPLRERSPVGNKLGKCSGDISEVVLECPRIPPIAKAGEDIDVVWRMEESFKEWPQPADDPAIDCAGLSPGRSVGATSGSGREVQRA